MKKILALFTSVLVAILLLSCAEALAKPLTRQEYDARGGTITEQERIESINYYFEQANPGKVIPTTVSLEEGAFIQDGKLFMTRMTFNVNNPDGTFYTSVPVDMTGSYMSVADDVVLLAEKTDGWFNEAGPLAVGGSDSTACGDVELKEGAPVLILETNGDLHGCYAAAGTSASTLVLGDNKFVPSRLLVALRNGRRHGVED